MKARITTQLPASQTRVWKLLKKSSTLVFVTEKWVTFKSVNPFPEEWEVGVPIITEVLMFGRPPGSPYAFTFEQIDPRRYRMRTRESGGLVKEWIHTMYTEAVSDDCCRYTDVVEVDAGLLTPMLWLYVKLYYRYRHKRWLELLQKA